MTRPDVGREAVYAAEIAAFEGTSYESVVPFDELAGLSRRITAAAWWPHGPVTVTTARTDARSSSTRQRAGSGPVVHLAAPQSTAATLLHELAHVLAGVAEGHGSLFRRAHVDLVGFAFGPDEAAWLLDAYTAVGLEVGTRRWSAPPPPTGGPIAL